MDIVRKLNVSECITYRNKTERKTKYSQGRDVTILYSTKITCASSIDCHSSFQDPIPSSTSVIFTSQILRPSVLLLLTERIVTSGMACLLTVHNSY
jgi:hypothetical protein